MGGVLASVVVILKGKMGQDEQDLQDCRKEDYKPATGGSWLDCTAAQPNEGERRGHARVQNKAVHPMSECILLSNSFLFILFILSKIPQSRF